MSITLLLSAAALAFALGAVAAILMRLVGLVALLLILGATAILRMVLGYPHPGWGETALVLIALQLGYAAAALGPWAEWRLKPRRKGRDRRLTAKDKTP